MAAGSAGGGSCGSAAAAAGLLLLVLGDSCKGQWIRELLLLPATATMISKGSIRINTIIP